MIDLSKSYKKYGFKLEVTPGTELTPEMKIDAEFKESKSELLKQAIEKFKIPEHLLGRESNYIEPLSMAAAGIAVMQQHKLTMLKLSTEPRPIHINFNSREEIARALGETFDKSILNKIFKNKKWRLKLENNINISAGDNGVIKLGNDIIELKSISKAQFTTDDFNSFVEYSKKYGKDCSIYYNVGSIELIKDGQPERNSAPLAVCTLSATDSLDILSSNINATQSIGNMEIFLKTMLVNLDEPGLNLLSKIQDFSVSKITKIERKSDNAGNYKFSISKEGAGDGDYKPPKKITITVPIFENMDIKHEFEFGVVFSFIEREHSADIKFKLENLNFNSILARVYKKIIVDIVKPLDLPKYYGNHKVKDYTDEWKYKENSLDISE